MFFNIKCDSVDINKLFQDLQSIYKPLNSKIEPEMINIEIQQTCWYKLKDEHIPLNTLVGKSLRYLSWDETSSLTSPTTTIWKEWEKFVVIGNIFPAHSLRTR